MMEFRYRSLVDSLHGFKNTNVPLVAQVENTYTVAGFTDDPGMYYFIPWIAKTFGISLDSAIHIFFGSMAIMAALISTLCFFLAFKNWMSRLITTFAMFAVAKYAYELSDVYVASFFAVASILPVFILWNRKKYALNSKIILSLIFSGTIISYCNSIRTNSGMGALLFLFFWILLNRNFSSLNKVVSTSILFIAMSFPFLHFYTLEMNRDHYIALNIEGHQPVNIVHPKWHSIYIGLGYVKNKYGLEYNDSVATDKIKSIDPNIGYCTNEYERALRKECIMLAKTDFLFILKNLLAKAYVTLLRILKFANVGLLLFFYMKPSMRCVFPILVAIAFYSLPGLLVVPFAAYQLGMITTATIFGVYMISLSLEKYENIIRTLRELQTKQTSI